jgi:hypothetical protein
MTQPRSVRIGFGLSFVSIDMAPAIDESLATAVLLRRGVGWCFGHDRLEYNKGNRVEALQGRKWEEMQAVRWVSERPGRYRQCRWYSVIVIKLAAAFLGRARRFAFHGDGADPRSLHSASLRKLRLDADT